MTKFVAMAVLNWVTPKAAAKHELLFNEPVSGQNVATLLTVCMTRFHTQINVDSDVKRSMLSQMKLH